jgi:hypothetical protein
MTISKNLGLLLFAGLLTPACALWGVEPEEIDVANEESDSGYSAGSSNSGDGDGDNGMNDTEGEEDPTGPGDGDPGDGDGDPGDGDGDGDPSTGDGDPGDGDGDAETGDAETGDGGVPCEMFEPTAVLEGDNAIEILGVMSSFEGSCGSAGPEAVFSFTATSDASYEFTLVDSVAFDGVLYLVDGICDPLDEIACEPEGQVISHDMLVGEVVYIIVDSDAGPGAATLSIAAI